MHSRPWQCIPHAFNTDWSLQLLWSVHCSGRYWIPLKPAVLNDSLLLTCSSLPTLYCLSGIYWYGLPSIFFTSVVCYNWWGRVSVLQVFETTLMQLAVAEWLCWWGCTPHTKNCMGVCSELPVQQALWQELRYKWFITWDNRPQPWESIRGGQGVCALAGRKLPPIYTMSVPSLAIHSCWQTLDSPSTQSRNRQHWIKMIQT